MPSSSHEGVLSQQLAKTMYRHPDLTKRDVLAALQHYRGLQPKQVPKCSRILEEILEINQINK